MIHFSVVEQALVRCSKKAGRQTFGQPRKGLYSFGKDYVCSVSAAKDSLNVYLENNPRYYPVRYVLVLELEFEFNRYKVPLSQLNINMNYTLFSGIA